MYSARKRPATARFLIGACLVSLTLPAIAQTVIMGVHPLYDGLKPGFGVVPIEVDLANTGPDAKGYVRATAGDYSMSYPVELPQGTKKKLITYPDCGQYSSSGLEYDLFTNRGHLHQLVETGGYGGQGVIVVGEISENGGDLGFMKASMNREYDGFTTQAAYLEPSDAPDRLAGYQRLNALVLGDGAERLSDDAVGAIKTWTLGGGTLIFIGGASAPILNDPRWSSVLAVQDATQKNFDGSKSLAARYGSSPEAFTAMVGKPAAGATARADGLVYEKPFGLGRSIYVAFNSFENPMLNWGSRPKFFNEILSPTVINQADIVIQGAVDLGFNPYAYGGGRYSRVYGYPYDDGNTVANNPFRATLPQTSKVLLILACYFIAVVPLNFIVLRKLKRGELAWGTAPLLSLAFAGVFFASAQDLYSAKLSTSTKGVLVLQQGDSQGLIVADSQMYFPHGGRYDLKLSGVDSLVQVRQQDYYYSRRQQHSIYEDLDPLDVGEVQGTISVPNLAFREMTYRERTQAKDWFNVQRLPDGRFSVSNNSDYTLVNARLAGGGTWKLIGDIAPKSHVEASFDSRDEGVGGDLPSRLAAFMTRSQGLALTGRIKGFRAGPRLGNEVEGSNGLYLAFVTNEKLRKNEISARGTSMQDFMDR